jgi:hypothetical protein
VEDDTPGPAATSPRSSSPQLPPSGAPDDRPAALVRGVKARQPADPAEGTAAGGPKKRLKRRSAAAAADEEEDAGAPGPSGADDLPASPSSSPPKELTLKPLEPDDCKRFPGLLDLWAPNWSQVSFRLSDRPLWTDFYRQHKASFNDVSEYENFWLESPVMGLKDRDGNSVFRRADVGYLKFKQKFDQLCVQRPTLPPTYWR